MKTILAVSVAFSFLMGVVIVRALLSAINNMDTEVD